LAEDGGPRLFGAVSVLGGGSSNKAEQEISP
jgi:hypothetical protein